MSMCVWREGATWHVGNSWCVEIFVKRTQWGTKHIRCFFAFLVILPKSLFRTIWQRACQIMKVLLKWPYIVNGLPDRPWTGIPGGKWLEKSVIISVGWLKLLMNFHVLQLHEHWFESTQYTLSREMHLYLNLLHKLSFIDGRQ